MRKQLRISMAALGLFAFAAAAQAQDAAAPAAKGAAPAAAVGDPAAGKNVFRKCKACHKVGKNARKGVGPPLNDIIGAKAGAQAGFRYSPGMKKAAAAGLTWTDDKLKAYLKKPRAVVPGGRMAFAGLRKPADLDNIVAYLKTFSPPKP